MKQNTMRLAAVAAVLSLAACGGGGGGGGGGGAATEVEGAAIKGTIRNADVELVELAGNSFDVAQGKIVGTGSTNGTTGAYRFTVSGYNGGAVVIRIKGRPSSAAVKTTVQCDFDRGDTDSDCGSTKFKEFFEVDQTFVVESFLPSLTGGKSNRMNTTALTSLLRSRAGSLLAGSNTKEAVRKAISQLNQLARANIVTDTPVDLTKAIPETAKPEEVAYAALNAAVLSFGEGATGQALVTDAIETLDDKITGGSDDASIPNADVRSLVDAARDLLPDDQAGALGVLTDLEMAAAGEGSFELPPTSVATGTAIEQARAFIANVRNTAQRYSQLPAIDESGFSNQLEAAGDFADAPTSSLFADVGGLLAAVSDHLEASPGSTAFTYPSQTAGGQARSASVTFSRSGSGTTSVTTARVANQDVGDQRVDLTVVFPTALDGATGASNSVTVSGSAQSASSSGVLLTVNTGTGVITSVNGSQPIESSGNSGLNIDKVVLDLAATLTQKGVSNPVSFKGTVGLTALQCKTSQGSPCTSLDQTALATPTRILLRGELSGSGGQILDGSIELRDTNEANARKFNVEQPYSSTNFVDGTIVVSAKAKVTNYPEGLLTVAVNSDGYSDTAELPIGDVTVSLSENGKLVLRITSQNSAANPQFTALNLTNGDNVTLTLNNVASNPTQDVELRGDLRVGTEIAGRVEQTSNGLVRVVYSDGSFESLFF